jgi:acyl carrier protein
MDVDATIGQAEPPCHRRPGMSDEEVFLHLRPLICEVTGSLAADVRMESVLMEDLGAESLDLLDLSFLIEERFGITIGSDEFEAPAKQRIPDGVYEKDGYLTPAALAELRLALPEVAPDKLREGLRKMELPSVLPVSVFVHLIQRKLRDTQACGAPQSPVLQSPGTALPGVPSVSDAPASSPTPTTQGAADGDGNA